MEWSPISFIGFVGSGVVGAIVAFTVLWLTERNSKQSRLGRGYVHIVGVLIIGVLGGAVGITLATLSPQLFRPETLGETSVFDQIQWPLIAAYLAMLIGMAASYMNKLIDERRVKIKELEKTEKSGVPGLSFDIWDFVQPFFVSLLTFGAIVARTKETDLLGNILLGFETGFLANYSI
jgi:hypothetical protein